MKTDHAETAFGTAVFENDLKLTPDQEKETTAAFLSFLMSRVEKTASEKRNQEVVAKCRQVVHKKLGLLLTESCLRKMLKAATTFDDDFDIDKSVWKSLELEEGSG